jgi:hypothetical protein
MVIFEHINTKKTVGLNYKVLHSFFQENKNFKIIHEYKEISTIVDYFLIRHPALKLLSFYKNKLYDFYGFNFLSDEFVAELSELIQINLFTYQINRIKPTKEIYEKFRSKETFSKFVQNLNLYKTLDRHLYPQTKYLNDIKYNKIIKIEKEIGLLTNVFPDINFKLKINTSNLETIAHFLNKNLEDEIHKEYNMDYIVGKYNFLNYTGV